MSVFVDTEVVIKCLPVSLLGRIVEGESYESTGTRDV